MANASEVEQPVAAKGEAGRPSDGILSSLQRAQAEMADLISGWERRVMDLERQLATAREELAQAEGERKRLAEDADVARRQMEHVRAKAERREERTERMTRRMNEIHGALVSGDVYAQTLRAALEMTGASRGMYLLAGREGRVRVCAAEGVADYPASPASPYLAAVCAQVLRHERAFICHTESAELPEPAHPDETFQNCVAARIPLHRDLTGVLLVGDRAGAEFDEEDVETLLMLGGQSAIAVQNAREQGRSIRSYATTLGVLAGALEGCFGAADGARRAARYARLTGRRLGQSGDALSVITHAAALRDIGKTGISDGVLNKPGPLSPEERELVRSHVRVGHEWIRRVPALRGVADAILRHHERWDGTGYPSGLRGENIPLAARVVGIADAYVAMTSHRSYRGALSPERAREELEAGAGTQFDPRVVQAFLAVLDAEDGAGPEEGEEPLEVLPGFAAAAHERPIL